MHELSLCLAIARTATDHANGRPVDRVFVRIGHFRQVVPDTLQFNWQMLTASTDLEGCVLEVEHVPATVSCRSCQAGSVLDAPVLLCPSCGSSDVTLLGGNELLVSALELAAD